MVQEIPMRKIHRESGVALATTLIVLLLAAALVAGFSWLVMTDQKLSGINAGKQSAFYGSEAGMEKLTADLGTLFAANSAPSAAQVNALVAAGRVPNIPGIQYANPDGSLGYQIAFPTDNNGNPLAQNHTILSGPYQGMVGLLTPFTLTVTSRTLNGGSEVRLQRFVQTVAIPAFQFGIFSQSDLSFFAGPNFNFGGRVHTNGNLYLAEGGGSTLTMADKVTAFGEVIRTNLSNGWNTNTNYTGTVNVPTAQGVFRALGTNEGSLTGTLGSPQNANWPTISLGNYNGYLRNSRTGAKKLNLSITLNGASPIDLIRRPVQNEDANNPATLAERYDSQASVRILLSDNAADIQNLPCTTASAPVNLSTLLPAQLGGVPIARSAAVAGYSANNGYWTSGALITGFIKIEIQTTYAFAPNPCGTWRDVTAEVLGLGIAGRNLYPAAAAGIAPPRLPALPGGQIAPSNCADPNPNAIIRLERVRDNPSTGVGNACGIPSVVPTDYWPNALFDTREGTFRDNCPGGNCNSQSLMLGGVMDYVELDVNNLARWLTGAIPGNGGLARDANNSTYNFVVYFSDRRGNYTPAAVPNWPPPSPSTRETGEYGFEDFVNPGNQFGCPNNSLDTGETLDQDENPANQAVGGAPESYGQASPALNPAAPYPQLLAGVVNVAVTPNPNCVGALPWPGWYAARANEARENVPMFFRRALKIVNGSNLNLGACPNGIPCGLTIVSENPAYIEGDYNAGANGNFATPNVGAAVIADAVTLLSKNWNDVNSFAFPYNLGNRRAATTTYRFADVSGKGLSFPQPNGYPTPQDFGTDGGVHNFLRYLENWGGQTLFFRGSVVSFYYNRQATGIYKCCNTVYSPPTRGYNFDTNFLNPSLLPPRTPMFRDVNTVGFNQLILPNQ